MGKYKETISIIPAALKATMVYTLASFCTKGLAIITMPIFTRLMPSSEIGIMNVYNSWYSIIYVISSLSLASGGFQLAMKEFQEERDQYISSIVILSSIGACVFSIFYIVATDFLRGIIDLPVSLIVLMLLQCFLMPAYDFWIMRQRYEYKYKLVGTISFLFAILASAISLGCVCVAAKAEIESLAVIRLYATHIPLLLLALVLWIKAIYKGRTLFSSKYWKFSLNLSIPLIVNALAAQLLSVSDRIMIARLVNNSAVGIYSTLYTISSLSLMVWQALNSSFVPYLFDNIDKPERIERINYISSSIFALFAVIAFLITVVAPEIVRIMTTNEYYEAIYIMPPIAAGVFLTAVTNMYSNILIYHKCTKYIMISTALAAVLNIILNAWLIPKVGYIAAAYTTLFAYIVHAAIQGMVAFRIHKTMTGRGIYKTGFIVKISIITIIACMLCLTLYNMFLIRYLVAAILLVTILIINKEKIIFLLNLESCHE